MIFYLERDVQKPRAGIQPDAVKRVAARFVVEPAPADVAFAECRTARVHEKLQAARHTAPAVVLEDDFAAGDQIGHQEVGNHHAEAECFAVFDGAVQLDAPRFNVRGGQVVLEEIAGQRKHLRQLVGGYTVHAICTEFRRARVLRVVVSEEIGLNLHFCLVSHAQ